jgi:hypothetical protein
MIPSISGRLRRLLVDCGESLDQCMFQWLLAQVASPSLSPSQTFWGQLAPKDWVSFFVAAVGLAVSLLNAWVAWLDRRRQTAIQTFLELIENLL